MGKKKKQVHCRRDNTVSETSVHVYIRQEISCEHLLRCTRKQKTCYWLLRSNFFFRRTSEYLYFHPASPGIIVVPDCDVNAALHIAGLRDAVEYSIGYQCSDWRVSAASHICARLHLPSVKFGNSWMHIRLHFMGTWRYLSFMAVATLSTADCVPLQVLFEWHIIGTFDSSRQFNPNDWGTLRFWS